MGLYLCGDVLLAPVALDNYNPPKTRPVVVIGTSEDGMVHACPVSSRPPADAPSLPLSINDFAQGGLDLFEDSYIMTSSVVSLRSGQVIGKRGRLTKDAFSELIVRVPDSIRPGPATGRTKPGRKSR